MPSTAPTPLMTAPRGRRLAVLALTLLALSLQGQDGGTQSCGTEGFTCAGPIQLFLSVSSATGTNKVNGDSVHLLAVANGVTSKCGAAVFEWSITAGSGGISTIEQTIHTSESVLVVDGDDDIVMEVAAFCRDFEPLATRVTDEITIAIHPCAVEGDACDPGGDLCCCGYGCDAASGSCLAQDLTGAWEFAVDVVRTTGICETLGEVESDPVITRITIVQTGCDISVSGWLDDPDNVLTGRARGKQVIFSGQYIEDGAALETRFVLTLDSPTEMSGTEYWEWHGTEPCKRSLSDVTAVRVE